MDSIATVSTPQASRQSARRSRIPPCHNYDTTCFFGAICGCRPITTLTNHFTLPTATICALYKARWQVELFFKWIKQHLRIKKFYGTSENAVKSQIWIAVSVYVLVAIVKKHLNLEASLYTLLQILSVTLFETMPLQQAFQARRRQSDIRTASNQLNLFEF